jgi:hypothetical protein
MRVRLAETDRVLRRMSNVQMGTNYAVLIAALTLSATLLLISDKVGLALFVIFLAVALGIAFLRLLRRIDRLDRMM